MTVEIKTKPGTLRVLEEIGVKNNSASIIDDLYSNMKHTFSGWRYKFVRFKEEKNKITGEKQINIQLGKEKGKGLEIFNQNLKEYEVIKENK